MPASVDLTSEVAERRLRSLLEGYGAHEQSGSPDPDWLFAQVAASFRRSAEILDEMVAGNSIWLAEVEARSQRIDRDLEANWRGLEQIVGGRSP